MSWMNGYETPDYRDAVWMLETRFPGDQVARTMMTRAINSLTAQYGNQNAGALILIEKLGDCDRSDLKFFAR